MATGGTGWQSRLLRGGGLHPPCYAYSRMVCACMRLCRHALCLYVLGRAGKTRLYAEAGTRWQRFCNASKSWPAGNWLASCLAHNRTKSDPSCRPPDRMRAAGGAGLLGRPRHGRLWLKPSALNPPFEPLRAVTQPAPLLQASKMHMNETTHKRSQAAPSCTHARQRPLLGTYKHRWLPSTSPQADIRPSRAAAAIAAKQRARRMRVCW